MHVRMDIFRDSKGFTLVELLVTLSLVGIVIAGGFTVYYFADRAFMSSSERADIQADVQLAMVRVTEEVRLAHSLKLLPPENVPSIVQDEDDHYLYGRAGSIFLKTAKGSPDTVVLDGSLTEHGYSVLFSVPEDAGEDPSLLEITIASLHPEAEYTLRTELQILNLRAEGIKYEDGSEEQAAIYFTKSFSPEELEEVERVRPGCIYRHRVYVNGASELDALRNFRDSVLGKNLVGRFVIRAYYAISPFVSSLLDYQPLARQATTNFLRGLAQVVIKST